MASDDRLLFDKLVKLQLKRKERLTSCKEFEMLVNLEERIDANMKGLIGEAITNYKSESNTEYIKDVKDTVKRYLNNCIVFNK